MRSDHLSDHLFLTEMDRREALKKAARAGAVGALAALGLSVAPAAAEPRRDDPEPVDNEGRRPGGPPPSDFDDKMFDVAAVEAGAWDETAFYHRGDQRGTFQEVTPEKTARALKILHRGQPTKTYNLGELLFNGSPAFTTTPPRVYNQRLTVLGYTPPPGFNGVLQSATPLGPNELSVHEERFKVPDWTPGSPYTMTYQIATQLDNLNHVGVGSVFYGGHRGPDIARTWGTNKLGNENMGPIVTRGMVLDILGLKMAQGMSVETATDPSTGEHHPHLPGTYRITVEDILAAMQRQRLGAIEPGDVVLFRTGWNRLVTPRDPDNPDDPQHPSHPNHKKYLGSEPGIYLREARWLAAQRPASVGSDTWGLEIVDPAVTGGNLFPCHQELLTHHGTRIGESVVTDELVADGVYEFVYIITPQYALGATAGSTPPAALGQPRH